MNIKCIIGLWLVRIIDPGPWMQWCPIPTKETSSNTDEKSRQPTDSSYVNGKIAPSI